MAQKHALGEAQFDHVSPDVEGRSLREAEVERALEDLRETVANIPENQQAVTLVRPSEVEDGPQPKQVTPVMAEESIEEPSNVIQMASRERTIIRPDRTESNIDEAEDEPSTFAYEPIEAPNVIDMASRRAVLMPQQVETIAPEVSPVVVSESPETSNVIDLAARQAEIEAAEKETEQRRVRDAIEQIQSEHEALYPRQEIA
jgi:hypothetical protein